MHIYYSIYSSGLFNKYKGNEEVNVFLKEFIYCNGCIHFIICTIVPYEGNKQKLLFPSQEKIEESNCLKEPSNNQLNSIIKYNYVVDEQTESISVTTSSNSKIEILRST